MYIIEYFKYHKKKMIEFKSYLKQGKFVLNSNLHTYIRKDSNTIISFSQGDSNIKQLLLLFIGRLLFSVRVKKNGDLFNADAVYFVNSPKLKSQNVKFFDFENKVTLTYCPSIKWYQMIMNNREKAALTFPLPELYSRNDDEQIYTEEIIPSEKWTSSAEKAGKVYHRLFDFYYNYFMKSAETNSIDADLLLFQHGDLSSDNILVREDGNIVFIDFDHSGQYPLYYDMLFLMFNEATVNNRRYGIDMLCNGEFDRYFNIPSCKYKISINLCLDKFANSFYSKYAGIHDSSVWINGYVPLIEYVRKALNEFGK